MASSPFSCSSVVQFQTDVINQNTLPIYDVSNDGSLIAIAEHSGGIYVCHMRCNPIRIQRISGYGGRAWHVACSPVLGIVITAFFDGTLRLWDVYRRRPVWSAKHHNERIDQLEFSKDGSKVISFSIRDKTVSVCSSRDGSQLNCHKLRGDVYTGAVSLSDDGQKVLMGFGGDPIYIWSLRDGSVVPIEHHTRVGFLALSPGNDKALAIAYEPGDGINVLDCDNGALISWYDAHIVVTAFFLPNGHRVVLGCRDGVRIWDIRTNQIVFYEYLDGEIECIRLSQDQQSLVCLTEYNGVYRVYKLSRDIVSPAIQDMICEKYGLPGGKHRLMGPFAGISLLLRWW